MLVQFFNNSIEQSFLKALLSAVQLPKYKVVKNDDLVFEDYFYIFNNKVIKCEKTGLIGSTAEHAELEHYYFCNMDQNIEFKEFIRASYYSTELHKRFGDYLRCLRDLYNVDLMGMYNCFDYEVFSDVHIAWTGTKNSIITKEGDQTKKVLAVPIKFNKKYTIYMTSNKPIYIAPILKLPNGKTTVDWESEETTYGTFDVKFFGNSQFNVPIEISIDLKEDQKQYYKYEKYLYLIVQLDSNNQSSFVVLEGDYKNSNNLKIISSEADESDELISLIYKPALIQINDGVSYAYSNTIMQYLLYNAITNIDTIDGNISYAKKLLKFQDSTNYWQNSIKYSAFVKYLLNLQSPLSVITTQEQKNQIQNKLLKNCSDVTGYIDKQIEGWLNA